MLYRNLLITILLACTSNLVFAQGIPPCFAAGKIKGKTLPTKTVLRDGRNVYRMNVQVPLRCLGCNADVTYYDSTCKIVASFRNEKIAHVFIDPAYKPENFVESNFPMYAKLIKKPVAIDTFRNDSLVVPECIAATIRKPDSLLNANVVAVEQVLLSGKIFYFFEKNAQKNLIVMTVVSKRSFMIATVIRQSHLI